MRLKFKLLAFITVFIFLAKPTGIGAKAINLKLNSSQLNQILTKDNTFYYLDTYLNPCLDNIEKCESGIGVMVNVSLFDLPDVELNGNKLGDNKLVLISSGGDSPYSIGGYYLHQLNANGEKYLEFGITMKTMLYAIRLYISPNDPAKLLFTWDSNGLTAYVDGLFYDIVRTPSKRPYLDVKYDPIKYAKTLIERRTTTVLWNVIFYDSLAEANTTELITDAASYFRGCLVSPKGLTPVTEFSGDSAAMIRQCKNYCITLKNQMFLINGRKCSCVNTIENFNKNYNVDFNCQCTNNDCWYGYVGTHAMLNYSKNEMGLTVAKYNLIEPVEVDAPVALKIQTKINNVRIYVDFDDGTKKNFINSGMAVHEYAASGTNYVNVTAVSLSNPKVWEDFQMEFRIVKKWDRNVMQAVKVYVNEIMNYTVDYRVFASGGAPFTCFFNLGDNSRIITLESTNRTSNFRLQYTYASSGLYNVSAQCRSDNMNQTVLNDWRILYLPDPLISPQYNVKDSRYYYENIKRIYLTRKNVTEDIELELPFKVVPFGTQFQIVDLVNQTNSFVWTHTRRQVQIVNYAIKINTFRLKNVENYFAIKTGDLILASYIIIIERKIDTKPEIKLLTTPAKPNELSMFNVKINKLTQNSILKFEFGDEDYQVYRFESVVDNQNATFDIEHTYYRVGQYSAKTTLSNHISTVQNSEKVLFDMSLPDFQLFITENITDLNDEVIFQLKRNGATNKAIVIDKIVFRENNDTRNPGIVVQTEYSFNEPIFTYRHKYSSYGLYNSSLQVVNTDNSFMASVIVKVGQDLSDVTTTVFNNYALIGEFVKVYVEIEKGNGYDVYVNFSETQQMYIPWAYINSNGLITNIQLKPGQVKPNVQIVSPRVMYVLYKYQRIGEFNIKVTVVNPFNMIENAMCSNTIIALPAQGSVSLFSCPLVPDNMDLRLSTDNSKTKSDLIKVSRAGVNTLQIKFQQCDQDVLLNGLRYYWTLTKTFEEFGIKYPRPVDKFCFNFTSKNEIVIEENQLDLGEYNVTVYVVNKNNPSMYRQLKSKTLITESAGLVAKIRGKPEVELNWNDSYVLDFYSESYDPEKKNQNDKSELNFDILCIKEDGEVSIGSHVQNEVDMKSYDFRSLGFTKAFEYKKIRFFERNCFHESNPAYLAEVVNFDKSTYNISINMSTLHLNESNILPITMRLYVYDDFRVAKAEQIVALNTSNSFLSIPLSGDLDLMAKQLDKLDDLAAKDPKMALKFVGSFADALNNIDPNDHVNGDITTTQANRVSVDDKMSNMRGKVLNTMDKIVDGVDDPSSMTAAAGATDSVTARAEQMPTANQESGSLVLEKMGEKAKTFKSLDPGAATDLTSSILGASGNVFDAAVKTVPVTLENRTIDLSANETEDVEPAPLPKKIAAPLEFYNCDDCEDFPEERYENVLLVAVEKEQKETEIRKKTADVARKSLKGVSGAAEALSNSLQANGSSTIQKKGLALSVSRKSANESNEEATLGDGGSGGSSISMPAFGDILGSTDGVGQVSTKLIISNSNPFQSVSSKSSVGGSIVTLQLSGENGEEIAVNGTKKPFIISIPNVSPVGIVTSEIKLLDYRYHKMYLASNDSAMNIIIIPQVKGDYYHVYISHTPNKTMEQYPNDEIHDYAFTVPTNDSYDESTEDGVDLKHTIFISNNETKGAGYYYIGIKLAKLSDVTKNQTATINHTITSTYNLKTFSPSCKYWKEETQDWRTDGCYVGRNTTTNMVQCLCYHLTTFGTDFYVPPNTIDFTNVWAKFKNLNENAAVFATVISILGLYVILAIWARHMDKKDLIKWGAVPLVDNLPTDNYYYLVSVQTGVGRDTSTLSNVGFVVVGEQADSGVRKLSDGKRKGFPSGSIYNFIMGCEEPLGNLTYLRVWHDNSGPGKQASWYLNMVNVLDIHTNEKFNFVCDQWLAVEKGDGEIDRILPVASLSDLSSFKHLFTQSVKKKFTDGHLWFSVFSRPTKSSFTRLQRISCCLSLLFCTMIANAMFYQAEDKVQNKTAVRIGPISFTLSQLFTSIISTLIVVPVNLLVVTIFRKAKLRHSGVIPTKTQYVAKQQHWRRTATQEVLGKGDGIVADNRSLIQKMSDFFCACRKENRTVEYKRDEDLEKRNQKQGRTFPYWTIYIGWILVTLSILVPAFFIILYSMEWGKDRSNAWLATMMLSFFQSVLVVDPVKVFIITAIITCILRKPEDDDDLIDSGDPFYNAIANNDEEFLNTTASLSQVNIQEALKSRRKKLSSLKVMDPVELSKVREVRLKEIKMGEIIREIFSYMFFLVVLLFLCHQSRHTNSYLMYDNMKKLFIENPVKPFEEIKSRPDFWTYVNDVFLPNLYAQTWYNNQTLTWREKLTLSNRYAIRVGAPRIRQLRVKDPSCRVSPAFKGIINKCRSDYNWFDDDAKSYDVGWVKFPNDTKKEDIKKCKTSWCYQNTIQTKSVPIMGTFTTYKGGGYTVTLGRTIGRAVSVLEDLKAKGWVDQLTRALFLEFTIFNPNVNLFGSATIIVEYLSTGVAINYHDIRIFRLYNYLGSFGVVVLVFQITFICFLVYFVITEISKIKNLKKAYFKEFWNLNEMIMIIFSIVSIAMYIMKNTFTTLAMKAVRESELGEFVNFNTIALWDDTFTAILAIVAFCATLKFLKLLRFNKRIGMLASTLKYASGDLASFSFTFMIFMLAYTQFGYLLYGNILEKYRNFLASLESVFLLLLGQFDFHDMMHTSGILGVIYLFSFIFLVFIGLMAMFMSILEQAFEQVKADVENQDNEHEMVDFIFNSVKKLVGIDKKNMKNKNENDDEIKKQPLEGITDSVVHLDT